MERLEITLGLTVLLLAACLGRAAAADTSYNLERDLKSPGTRSVTFFGTDPLLGIPSADSTAPPGIVKHFERSDGTLLGTLQSPAPATGDRFGFSLATTKTLIIVGAPGDDAAGPDTGAVFVFEGASGALVQTLRSPTPAANAQFGFAVAARGDNVIVGSPFAGGTQADSGVAYLFDAATGELLLTFSNADATGDDFFGAAVASLGDDVLIGAPLDDGTVPNSGAVFLFDGDTGTRLNVFRSPQPDEGELFGSAVGSLLGDIVVGAPFADGAGRVFRFLRGKTAPIKTYLPPELPPTGATAFGTVVTNVGGNLLVSAPGSELEQHPAAFILDGGTGAVRETFFPLVPVLFRGRRFEPPLAASGKDVLIEDALFGFCGRGCVAGCGNGIIEDKLGESCDGGGEPTTGCTACVEDGALTNLCYNCGDGDLCTQDVCCIGSPAPPASPTCMRCSSPEGCTQCTSAGCFKCATDTGPCDIPCETAGGCLTCDPGVCAGAGSCAYPRLPGCDCHSDDECRDANVCNGSERCRECTGCFLHDWPCCDTGSRCAQRDPLQCDDHDPCTIDSCDPQTGCRADAGGCPVPTTSTSTTTMTTTPTTGPPTTGPPTTTPPTTTPPTTSPVPPATTTSTSPTPSVTTSTVPHSIPGAICDEDSDCAGALCDGNARCVNGRCVLGKSPACFEAASCVLGAGLPLGSCPKAPPARVTHLFENAYVLVLGAEAAVPSSLKVTKRRLRAAVTQLMRAEKQVRKLGDKNKLPTDCAAALTTQIAAAHARAQTLMTDLTTCATTASSAP